MANLGYPPEALRRINPRLVVVGVRAFPSGSPEGAWVAFGRGVHAASGLGVVGGRPAPAQLAYPDALAGLLAFGVVLDAIAAGSPATIEVSLAAAVAPLLPTAGRPLAPADPDDRRAAPRRDGRPPRRRHRPGVSPVASATRSTGWRTVRPAAARCIAHPGLALATTVAPDRSVARATAATLRSRTTPASSGCSAE